MGRRGCRRPEATNSVATESTSKTCQLASFDFRNSLCVAHLGSASQTSIDVTDVLERRQPVFELSQAKRSRHGKPQLGQLLIKRPVAAIALVPEPAILFTSGAIAGALGENRFTLALSLASGAQLLYWFCCIMQGRR